MNRKIVYSFDCLRKEENRILVKKLIVVTYHLNQIILYIKKN